MGKSRGYRYGTRYMFARGHRKHGIVALSNYLRIYKVGDFVDIKVNGAIQKGMPHKFYHGKTGVVFSVSKSSVGVIVHKVVRNRYVEKKVFIRVEHVHPSRCQEELINRRRELAAKRAAGEKVQTKRLPAQPRQAHVVKLVSAEGGPEIVTPIPYETLL